MPRFGFVFLLAVVVSLSACGGGGNDNQVPDPTPKVADLNGRYISTLTIYSGSIPLFVFEDPLILVSSGLNQYRFIQGDGKDYGTLVASSAGFNVTLTEESSEGTGTYRYTVELTGAIASNSLDGSGTATVQLVSGIDSEDIDGGSIEVFFHAERQGLTPTGVAPQLSGNYLAQFDVIDAPPGFAGSYNTTLTLSSLGNGVYSVVDDDPVDPLELTLVAIGSTWYMLGENYMEEDFTEYEEQSLFSGDLSGNSFSGAGYISWESLDGSDNAGLDGAQVQMSLNAARLN